MASFDLAFDHILEVEGGYSHHPLDRGGETNFGVTQKTWDVYLRSIGVKSYPVEDINISDARTVYKQLYWDRLRLRSITSAPISLCMMDQGVNIGVRRTVKRAQKTHNTVTPVVGKPLTIDGVIGPRTVLALNFVNERDFVWEFIKESQLYYADLVKRSPDQRVFLKGWLRRTQKLFAKVNRWT